MWGCQAFWATNSDCAETDNRIIINNRIDELSVRITKIEAMILKMQPITETGWWESMKNWLATELKPRADP